MSEHLVIREANEEKEQAVEWARSTPDGDLLDLDAFEHDSTFLLAARQNQHPGNLEGTCAYLPVQQPLMLENLIFRPGMSDGERARAITRLTEYAISEAYRRDVGEVYFLCREAATRKFAERHLFRNVREVVPGVEVYRLNLRETFGA